MIISRVHGYLFVEVPNTGSTAISSELTKHYGGERFLHKHATLGEFLKTPEARQGSYFVFSTVRHPLDAAVTAYFKMKSNHRGRFTSERLRHTPSVTQRHVQLFELVRTGASFPDFFRRLQTGVYNNYYLLQHHRFDYVMRYERLQNEFAEVLSRLGISQVAPIPEVNRTSGKSSQFWDCYTEEIRPRAMRLYWPYMRRWGYSFPPEWGEPQTDRIAEFKFVSTRFAGTVVNRALGLGPNSPKPWAVTLRELLRRSWG
jgi:hypothetical protein